MSSKIPDRIIEEIARFGGIEGILAGIPNQNKLSSLASSHEVLSSVIRIRLLLGLKKGELCVCVLKRITSCPDTRLSYHLSRLKKAGLVSSRRQKSFLKYSLTKSGRRVVNHLTVDLKPKKRR